MNSPLPLAAFLDRIKEMYEGSNIPVRVDVEEYDLDDAFNEVGTPKRAVFLNIQDPDKLLEVLFTESLKSKIIVSVTVENSTFFERAGLTREEFNSVQGVCLTIVLRQTSDGETNIDADVLGSFTKVFLGNDNDSI